MEASLLLPSTSSTEDYRLLYQSLFYFYDNTYYLNFEGYTIEQKMDFLFNLISADALAVLPYPYREQKIINLIITLLHTIQKKSRTFYQKDNKFSTF